MLQSIGITVINKDRIIFPYIAIQKLGFPKFIRVDFNENHNHIIISKGSSHLDGYVSSEAPNVVKCSTFLACIKTINTNTEKAFETYCGDDIIVVNLKCEV